MKKVLAILLMSIVPIMPNFQLLKVAEEQKFIQENNLEYKRVTCYLPTGSCCADGSPTEVGTISTNKEHLGQKCILYRADTLEVIGEYVSHDIGGHKDLVNGSAIDVFAPDMDAAWAWIRKNGDHVYLKWIDE